MRDFIKIFIISLCGVTIALMCYLAFTNQEFVKETLRYFSKEATVASPVPKETEILEKAPTNPQPDQELSIHSEVSHATVIDEEPIPKVPVVPEPLVLPKEILLDVPLLNQMDAPRLYNGCEVTSLAMLLQYHGHAVTKNELASKITRVPLKYPDGKNGNPHVGFVGNMEDGPGLGVYHKPIFQLADSYAPGLVENLTKQPFSVVIEKLAAGMPVWVITTANFAPTSEMKTWTTPQGPVAVTFKMHSVVITGFDEDSIYVNDPYGVKNRKVNKDHFIQAWAQMGSQAIVIHSTMK
jgi:uncharacterized protein YvpB